MPTTYNDLIADIRKSIAVISLEEIKRAARQQDARWCSSTCARKKSSARGYIPARSRSRAASSRSRSSATSPTTRPSSSTARAARARCSRPKRSSSSATRTCARQPRLRPLERSGLPREAPPQLTDAQRDRYSRHVLLPEVGLAGQAKLLASKVLCSARVAWARQRAVPRRRRRGHARPRRRRHRRRLEPAAPDPPRHRRARDAQGRQRREGHQEFEPRRERRSNTRTRLISGNVARIFDRAST